MKIPTALLANDPDVAAGVLRKYFGHPYPGMAYTGAMFDDWDSTGTRETDLNRFTADDLVAVSLLSVEVGPVAARIILRDAVDEFAALLEAIGPDRDLVGCSDAIDADWPAWQLDSRLRQVPGIGRTIASKLTARKRPRLCPIWDTVVADVLGTHGAHVEPVRVALRSDDALLHQRLTAAHTRAGLPPSISSLRVLDVIAWMEGKDPGSRHTG